MKIYSLIVAGLFLIISEVGAGTGSSREVPVYSPGSESCGAWLDAREGAKANKNDVRLLQYKMFLNGFASAYNWYVDDAHSPRGIFGETDVYAKWSYIDKYCRDNPTNAFAVAIVSLLKHLKLLQQ